MAYCRRRGAGETAGRHDRGIVIVVMWSRVVEFGDHFGDLFAGSREMEIATTQQNSDHPTRLLGRFIRR
jgi:hypothetical protein